MECSDQIISYAILSEFRYVYAILFFTCSLVIIILNVTSLVVLFKPSMRSLIHTYFVTSLAISDAIVGFIVCPFVALLYFVPPYYSCMSLSILMVMLCAIIGSSASSLAAIAYDRFLMLNPTHYHNRMTPRVVKSILGVSWGLPTLISFTLAISLQVFTFFVFIYGLLITIVIVVCYRLIIRRINRVESGSIDHYNLTISFINNNNSTNSKHNNQDKNKTRNSNSNNTKTNNIKNNTDIKDNDKNINSKSIIIRVSNTNNKNNNSNNLNISNNNLNISNNNNNNISNNNNNISNSRRNSNNNIDNNGNSNNNTISNSNNNNSSGNSDNSNSNDDNNNNNIDNNGNNSILKLSNNNDISSTKIGKNDSLFDITNSHREQQRNYRIAKNKRLARRLFILIVAYGCCLLPVIVALISFVLGVIRKRFGLQTFFDFLNHDSPARIHMRSLCNLITVFNSLINPIIYVYTFPKFKGELKKMRRQISG